MHHPLRTLSALVLPLLLVAPALMAGASSGPAVSDLAVDARATAAVLTWTTSEPATSRVEYGVGDDRSLVVEETNATTDHRVVLTRLSPGTTVGYRILSDDGEAATVVEGSFATTTALTYYLHNRGAEFVQTVDEFDDEGDNDGRGYNGFGAAASTAESKLGSDVLAVTDVYPAANGGLLLAEGTATATLYVKFTASGPTVQGTGTNVLRGAPAVAHLRVSVLAAGEPVGAGVAEVVSVPGGDFWHEVKVDVPVAATAVAAGTLAIRVKADDATAGYAFGFEGDHASRVTLPVEAGVPSAPVRKTDFTQGARVVVAVIDSGVNPYHPVYQRPGAVLPLDDFRVNGTGPAPRPVALSPTGTYAERVTADDAAWSGIAPYELVWFEGTNVMAVSVLPPADGHVIRDTNGHGTWTTSTVLANFPDALVVLIQIDSAAGLGPATQWAVEQPWIDVVSTSWGAVGNLPIGMGGVPTFTKKGFNAGKVLVNSAGNDPSPLPSDSQDGPWWVLAVTGSQAEGRGKEVLSANVYPDYVADYAVWAAHVTSAEDEYQFIGGTSFSCPTVAGTVAGIVYKLREAKGHEGGIVNKELAPGVTNRDVRAALNKTAIVPAPGYVAGVTYNGDHAHPPGAEFLTAQWGHVDDKVIDASVAAILAGDYGIPPEKALVAQWKALTYAYRDAYWS